MTLTSFKYLRRLCEHEIFRRILWKNFERTIVNSAENRLDELNKMMPKSVSKERGKIREKKPAHGQKKGADGYGTDDEEYFGRSM